MAEVPPTQSSEDQVDPIFNEVIGHEYPPLLTVWETGKSFFVSMDEGGMAVIGISNRYGEGNVVTPWNIELRHRGIYNYVIDEAINAFQGGSIEEIHSSTHDQSHKEQEESESLRSENSILRKKVLLLQNEVLSFYDTVQFAAVSVLFICALSITTWLTFDVRLLSPLISIIGVIGAPFFMGMAWIGKKELTQKNNQNKTG